MLQPVGQRQQENNRWGAVSAAGNSGKAASSGVRGCSNLAGREGGWLDRESTPARRGGRVAGALESGGWARNPGRAAGEQGKAAQTLAVNTEGTGQRRGQGLDGGVARGGELYCAIGGGWRKWKSGGLRAVMFSDFVVVEGLCAISLILGLNFRL